MKSLSRRQPSFGPLLRYIARHAGREKTATPGRTRVVILHNLQTLGRELEDVEREFRENARYLPPRKNGVALFHEILSLGRGDAPAITPEVLGDLANQYLLLRAPGSLAYGEVHWETGTPHVHLMISGNQIESGRKTHLTRAGFARVKQQLERYQRERYPHLTRSQVDHESAGRGRSLPEDERQRRLSEQGRGEPSRKEVLADLVTRLLASSSSAEHFHRQLQEGGLRPYVRGRNHGIHDPTGRRIRLRTLVGDLYEEAVHLWQRQEVRAQELDQLAVQRLQRQLHELGFRQQLQAVLADPEGDARMEDVQGALQRRWGRERDRIL